MKQATPKDQNNKIKNDKSDVCAAIVGAILGILVTSCIISYAISYIDDHKENNQSFESISLEYHYCPYCGRPLEDE